MGNLVAAFACSAKRRFLFKVCSESEVDAPDLDLKKEGHPLDRSKLSHTLFSWSGVDL